MGNMLLHRKESLILTAIEIIDELGIQGLSTREIARRQGVSEATLFRHYKNKNELILAVLDNYSQYDADIMTTARLKTSRPLEAIIFFINSYVEYYENYPAITSITQAYDVLACEPNLGSRIKHIFTTRAKFLQELIEEAQRAGEIDPDTDSEKLTDTILGICRSISLKWRFNRFNFSLKEYTLSTLGMVLKAFSTGLSLKSTEEQDFT